MPIDTLIAYIGIYADVDDALADYAAIKDLHTQEGLIDAFDAAVIERKDDGKVKISKKHETPTRAGGVVGGGIGLAAGLVIALFPAAAIGTGLLAGATAGGAALGAWAGHAAAGMSRHDLKEVGEQLDEGEAAVILVGVSDLQAKVDQAMAHARKKEQKELKADRKQAEKDAKQAEKEEKADS
jgi:uncharacterized membrane protein